MLLSKNKCIIVQEKMLSTQLNYFINFTEQNCSKYSKYNKLLHFLCFSDIIFDYFNLVIEKINYILLIEIRVIQCTVEHYVLNSVVLILFLTYIIFNSNISKKKDRWENATFVNALSPERMSH